MYNRDQYAGFWSRFLALIIDYNLVLLAIFPFFLLGGLLWPNLVKVEIPFGLFTSERVVEPSMESVHHTDGSVTVIEETISSQTASSSIGAS